MNVMLNGLGGLGDRRRGNKAAQSILGSLQAGEARSAAASGEEIDWKWLRVQLSRWRAKTKRLKLRIEPQT